MFAAKSCDRTTSLLEAAQRLGGSVLKRVVLSGSTASVSNYFQSNSKAREPYTEADWSEVGNPIYSLTLQC
jgi:nucleoside-diphosphate-sugar epimerase